MSVAEQVTAHLPYLRRFARAVTGSQKSGDEQQSSSDGTAGDSHGIPPLKTGKFRGGDINSALPETSTSNFSAP